MTTGSYFIDAEFTFSPDGRLLALERGDGVVRLIEVSVGLPGNCTWL